jgi:hypothetical protein
LTVEPERKPLPFTVSVNAGPPALTVAGCTDVIEGVWENATEQRKRAANENRIFYIVIRGCQVT